MVKSVLEYGLLIDRVLSRQKLTAKQRARVKCAYLKIFKDGIDFANGHLKVEGVVKDGL